MHITILGGGGFLGQKLAARLAKDGAIGGKSITALTLFDLHHPPVPNAHFPIHSLGGTLTALPSAAIPPETDIIFHLAAVVSAAAEADYDLGREVNVRGTDAVIDACRALPRPPRVVFTSSVASFGGGQDALLEDDARQVPANSYGAQKAAAELFLADASRRGFLDAVLIRLPTVVIRPGRPNQAASSFVSGILREPLLGLPADLPVPDDFAVWICSPRRAIDWLLHAGSMDTAPMGLDRAVNPPGLRAIVNVSDMLIARLMDRIRPGASALVRRGSPIEHAIASIVNGGWPAAFQPATSQLGLFDRLSLGFVSPHGSLGDDLIAAFIADDLDGNNTQGPRGKYLRNKLLRSIHRHPVKSNNRLI